MASVLWTQRQDIGPSARTGHGLAYDAARQQVVLFGGTGAAGALQADTWGWDGGFWSQLADTGPDARAGHALAFDSTRGRVVLFGGEAAGGTLRADTWEWDGQAWTQVADTGPDARAGHALAFDSARGRVVLFGGEATGPAQRADTWEWDGNSWTQVADTGPTTRRAHAMSFDAGTNTTILFGGTIANVNANDTWTWDGAAWTQVADMGPNPIGAGAIAFAAGPTLLFGGVASAPAPPGVEALSGLSWEWDGQRWTLRQNMGPAPRWGHGLAFDSQRGRVVLSGGGSVLPSDPDAADRVLGDTWEATVTEVHTPGAAPAIASFTITPDHLIVANGEPVTFQVGLDRPALAGGAAVDLFGAAAEPEPVFDPGAPTWLTVLVAEGETSGVRSEIFPPEIADLAGEYVVEARLGDSVMRADFRISP